MKYHAYLLLGAVLVAGSFLVSEQLSAVVNPYSLTLLRFLGAGLILFPLVLSKQQWRSKIFSTLPRAGVMSFFYSGFFICFFESLKTTSALNTGTLYTLVPFVTALLCLVFLRESISIKQVVIYMLGVVGTCWVIFNGSIDLLLSFSLNRGDMIFSIGALLMCCQALSMKLLYRDDDLVVLVFCTCLGGSMWMSIAVFATGQPLEWHLIQGRSLFSMAYLVLVATLGTLYLYQKATIGLGPGKVMSYSYLNPVIVAVLMLIFQNVSIEAAVMPGILLSLLATAFLQLNTKQVVPQGADVFVVANHALRKNWRERSYSPRVIE